MNRPKGSFDADGFHSALDAVRVSSRAHLAQGGRCGEREPVDSDENGAGSAA